MTLVWRHTIESDFDAGKKSALLSGTDWVDHMNVGCAFGAEQSLVSQWGVFAFLRIAQ